MKKIFVLLFAIAMFGSAFSQIQITTVTFKPGSDIGQDASIWYTGNCIPNTQTTLPANTNYGNRVELMPWAWTWAAMDCYDGIIRSLLRFDQLATIPENATILKAELKLYGVSTSNTSVGNSCYPGSPYNSHCPNRAFIEKVTSPWDEQTVTWNTQPTTTTANRITIPQSTSQWNWNFTDSSTDLITMIQDMVTTPEKNFGFMLKLETEVHYRGVMFASSDHVDSLLWPELKVTYSYTPTPEPCPCEANFSYIVSTVDPLSYHFMAANPAKEHIWEINGRVVSNEGSFTYNFRRPGTYEVCYNRVLSDTIGFTNKPCRKCINICITGNEISTPQYYKSNVKTEGIKTQASVPQGIIPPGDDIFANAGNYNNKIMVYPNPTTNGWTVKVTAEKEENIKLVLSDMAGKVIYSADKMLDIGVNSFDISTDKIISGTYSFQIIGKTIQFSNILLKN